MVFSSITFLFIFLPVTAALYFLPPVFLHPKNNGTVAVKSFRHTMSTYKNAVLCIASLLFYAWGEPVNVLLMLISIVFNYCIGLDMQSHDDNPKHRKILFVLSLVFNIGALAFFKYGDFVAENINAVFGSSISFGSPSLPIGISFYTFQILSYVVDVYKRRVSAQPQLLDFALYISLFPQLIAGPIVQYSTIDKQLRHRTQSFMQASDGIKLFVVGLSKKVILANAAGSVFTEMTSGGTSSLTALGAWGAMLFYTFQIYYDFSGYSDMAIGLGRIFGFEFPENFNHPYVSESITEFWRRWHISLSGWFRDYVYIPLGGSRCSLVRNIFNLFAVWFLTGLWHGASWNFVLWGLYYFILLTLEKYVFAGTQKRIPKNLRRVITFILVMFGWVLFSNVTLSQSVSYFGAMFGMNGAWDYRSVYLISTNIALLVAAGAFATPLFSYKRRPKNRRVRAFALTVSVLLFAACIVCLISDTYNPFLYFRF